jgi:hypothetical protein
VTGSTLGLRPSAPGIELVTDSNPGCKNLSLSFKMQV